ncbi:MAG: 30S ribosomal protein S20 [Rickettsiales bacterium]|nr:30S ribosomal protein S20 [Rickettsiales bacterium]
MRITARRTAINKSRKSRIRTFLRKVEDAVLAKNKELAKTALVEFESEIMKGVSKGVYKKNTAARKIRRMAKQVNSI